LEGGKRDEGRIFEWSRWRVEDVCQLFHVLVNSKGSRRAVLEGKLQREKRGQQGGKFRINCLHHYGRPSGGMCA